MTTAMPALETPRLTIRPFVMEDLEAVHSVLSAAWGVPPEERAGELVRREWWLRWTVAGYDQLPALYQPPYGDRAVTLKVDGTLVGSVGLVPSLGPFGRLPGFPAYAGSRYWYPEVGLYWAVDPAHQRRGYATEAAGALMSYALGTFNLGRIIATTEHANEASVAVMRKLGMRILRNPLPEPAWLQVVGLLEREAE